MFTTDRRVAGGRPFATVGVSDLHSSVGARLPRIAVSLRPGGSGTATATFDVSIWNHSAIPQYGLQVYAIGIRAGREVEAGRGEVTHLGTYAKTTLSVTLLGAARGATLRADRITDDLQLGAASMSATDSEQTLEAPAVARPPAEYETCEQCGAPVDANQRLLRRVRDTSHARLRPGGSVSCGRHEPVTVRFSSRARPGCAKAPLAGARPRAGPGRDPTRGGGGRAHRRSGRQLEHQAARGAARSEGDGRQRGGRRHDERRYDCEHDRRRGRCGDAGRPVDQQLRRFSRGTPSKSRRYRAPGPLRRPSPQPNDTREHSERPRSV